MNVYLILISQLKYKNLGLYELNKKLTLARERGFIFNQINNFKKKF